MIYLSIVVVLKLVMEFTVIAFEFAFGILRPRKDNVVVAVNNILTRNQLGSELHDQDAELEVCDGMPREWTSKEEFGITTLWLAFG